MRRAVNVSAVVVGLLLAVGLVFAGRYGIYRLRAASYDPPMAFGLAQVHPEFGDGSPVDVVAGRLLYDRSELEVVVAMGRCDALSALKVTETPQRVTVAARAASLPGDCSADVKAVFAYVPLRRHLGDRVLVDAHTGRRITVVVCGSGGRFLQRGLCYPGRYGL